MLDEGAVSNRAKFWRRAFALLIDSILVSFVLAVIGLMFSGMTDGRIRVGSTLVNSNSCSGLSPHGLADLGVTLPKDFHPTSAVRCTKTIFGYAFDRTLAVEELTQTGVVFRKLQLTYPLDRDGHVVDAFYLDKLWLVFFAGYVILLEWKVGRTLGKRMLHVRVLSLTAHSLTLAQALKRFAVRFFPMILGTVLFFSSSIVLTLFSSVGAILVTVLIFASMVVAILVNFVRAVRRGELPWHDRFAGTKVVRAT